MKYHHIGIQYIIIISSSNDHPIACRLEVEESTGISRLYIDGFYVDRSFQSPSQAYESLPSQLIRWDYPLSTVRTLRVEVAANVLAVDEVEQSLSDGGLTWEQREII